MSKAILLCILSYFIFNGIRSYGQNRFLVRLVPPLELQNTKLDVTYDDGKEERKVEYVINDTPIDISGFFFSRFCVIELKFEKRIGNLPDVTSYFASTKPALLDLSKRDASGNIREKVVNAHNIKEMGENRLNQLTAEQKKAITDFYSRPRAENDTTWDEQNRSLWVNLINKQLEFIRANRGLYYSLWIFRKQIAPSMFMDPDSLMTFYNTYFSDSQKDSFDGRQIETILNGRRIAASEQIQAPGFRTRDIYGNPINFDGKSTCYLLLNFWATWCGPCVDEMPALKEIGEKYSTNKLKIISISFDRDSSEFLKYIKQLNLNSAHIYRDKELAKAFGVGPALPMLYLISPDGKILYNRMSGKEVDYVKLLYLRDVLRQKLEYSTKP